MVSKQHCGQSKPELTLNKIITISLNIQMPLWPKQQAVYKPPLLNYFQQNLNHWILQFFFPQLSLLSHIKLDSLDRQKKTKEKNWFLQIKKVLPHTFAGTVQWEHC